MLLCAMLDADADATPVGGGRRRFGATSLLHGISVASCAILNIVVENRPAFLRVHSGP